MLVSRSVRLAVVEDQRQPREDLVERLCANYANSEVAGFVTLEEFFDSGREFDLVILDWHLRGGVLEGRDAVHAAAQHARVLVFAGLVSGEAVEDAQAAGALGFVSKDTADATVLIEGMDAVLAGQQFFVDPELLAKIASQPKVLPERLRQVLRLEALGLSAKQIARDLNISKSTVDKHIERIVKIYPHHNKQTDRVKLAIEMGLVTSSQASQKYSPPSP
jgi:DNA-binding NarL/FixJ family response regulator